MLKVCVYVHFLKNSIYAFLRFICLPLDVLNSVFSIINFSVFFNTSNLFPAACRFRPPVSGTGPRSLKSLPYC